MGVAGRRWIDFVAEKWGGAPHYAGVMCVLGDDEHGTWLWGPAGRTISRGGTPAFVTEYDVVAVVPTDRWWNATWWLDHQDVEVYVNVASPATHEEGSITYVDLDLDVIRRCTGECELLDQDEFATHQVQLAYPPEVIAATEQAAAEVLRAVRADEAPFDGVAARRWAEIARAAALPAP